MGTSPHMIERAMKCYDYIKKFNNIEGEEAKRNHPNPETFIKFAYHASVCKRARIASGMSTLGKVFLSMTLEEMGKYDNMFFENIIRARRHCFVDDVMNINMTEQYFTKYMTEKNKDALVIYKALYDKESRIVTGLTFIKQMMTIFGEKLTVFIDSFQSIKGKKEEFMLGANLLFWYLVGFDQSPKTDKHPVRIDELKVIFTDNVKRELDDYVVKDRHVSSKYGMDEFVKNGSVVTNHSEIQEALALRKFYEDTRLIEFTDTNEE